MHPQYIVTDGAKEKLKRVGILDIIEEKKKAYELSHIVCGALMEWELQDYAKQLVEDGFYEKLKGKLDFFKTMDAIAGNPKGNPFRINHYNKDVVHVPNAKDIAILMGWFASCLDESILDKFEDSDFWTPNEFFGAVGALMFSINRLIGSNDGYVWESEYKGRKFVTKVTGDGDLDFRLYRTDITEYRTFDPFGTAVGYRPITHEDRGLIASYHSVEPIVMTVLYKYMHEQNMGLDMFADLYGRIEEVCKGLGAFSATATEQMMPNHFDPLSLFIGWDIPMNTLDETLSTEGMRQMHHLPMGMSRDAYSFFVGPEKELMIGFDREGVFKPEVVIPKAEIPEFFIGMFYQSAQMKGRTHISQLVQMHEFRMSPDFDKIMEEWSCK